MTCDQVYEAEARARVKCGRRTGLGRRMPVRTLQAIADAFCDRAGLERVEVVAVTGDGDATYWRTRRKIYLPLWARSVLTLAHELAHHADRSGGPVHGPAFLEAHVLILRALVADEVADVYEAEYRLAESA